LRGVFSIEREPTAKAAVVRLLGLARRAGALRLGATDVSKALRREPPGVVFLAADAGADLVGRVEAAIGRSRLERSFTGRELADAFGRERLSVVSVHESGFVRGILEQLVD
jgi:ribosomal protein L7Ae-like RNA K-turn-binding protein